MGWAEGQAPPVLLPTSPVAGISGYFRETIRQDIRQAKERFSGQQLRQELARLQRRLDSVELLSPDIIMNLLLSYRDVQVCSDGSQAIAFGVRQTQGQLLAVLLKLSVSLSW